MKMTNGEASKLMAPVIDELFGSKDRHFPITDAFMLKKAVEAVRGEMRVYQETFRAICDKNGAKADDQQRLVYPTAEAASAAANGIAELNKIEVDFNFKKVKAKKDWPSLSLMELSCLEPVLDTSELEG